MFAQTNGPYPDRIQLVLTPFTGPLTQAGPLAGFDPRRDLQIYVDGSLLPVRTFVFDIANNRYLMFMNEQFNLQGVIQVIYHLPNPPFHDSIPTTIPGFSLLASYTANGDTASAAESSLAASPSTVAPNTAVILLWDTINVAKIEITGNNGVDAAFDTGKIQTNGSGAFTVNGGWTTTINLTLNGYDASGTLIGGLTPATFTVTVT